MWSFHAPVVVQSAIIESGRIRALHLPNLEHVWVYNGIMPRRNELAAQTGATAKVKLYISYTSVNAIYILG